MASDLTHDLPRIVTDPSVRFGKPVIRGTRICVDEIVGLLASGLDKEAVAEEFGIVLEDVHAALDYAAMSVAPRAYPATPNAAFAAASHASHTGRGYEPNTMIATIAITAATCAGTLSGTGVSSVAGVRYASRITSK